MTTNIHPALLGIPKPLTSFASDNSAGAHPLVMQAIVDANTNHSLAYGSDPWTEEVQKSFKKLFGEESETFLVWGGTGANVMALATLIQAGECVVCSDKAHIALDETGAPERALGAKIMMLPTTDGKIKPEQIAALSRLIGVQHHAQPGVLSLTQSTELGTIYSAEEIKDLCQEARKLGMRVHLDGARIANATVALGNSIQALQSFTKDAGIDVVCFGGTKAGLAFGEAVVYLKPEHAKRAKYVRKQVNQLPSKMRFVSVQFSALLKDNLWLQLAVHSNNMATRLYEATKNIEGLVYNEAPTVNGLFPILPEKCIAPLADWCKFWMWDANLNQVRWMTSWDTTEEDVARFAAGVKAVLGHNRS